ncbi:MAG: hypothetical protein K6T31_03135 [Alicyclobacillus sp.]|nr:hypothetical protein [Alicyclobacillus sp.]
MRPVPWVVSKDGTFRFAPKSKFTHVLNTEDASKVLDNLRWWLLSYKIVDGKYVLHVPFYNDYWVYGAVIKHNTPESNYHDALVQATHWYDQIQVWGSPDWSKIYVQLPDTSGTNVTQGVAAYHVIYGNMYGLYPTSPDQGGTTVVIPNVADNYGFAVSVLTMNETPDGGIGFTVSYAKDHKVANMPPNFNKPYEISDGQGQTADGQ